MNRYLVSVQRHIAAEPARLFDIVATPTMHPVMDGSGTVLTARDGNPPRLCLGASFGMDMKLGTSYRITNRVIEFEDPRRIAWRHFNGHLWRYVFESAPGGTLVTEQWDASKVWNRWLLGLVGFPERNRAGMTATLERLADLANAGDPLSGG